MAPLYKLAAATLAFAIVATVILLVLGEMPSFGLRNLASMIVGLRALLSRTFWEIVEKTCSAVLAGREILKSWSVLSRVSRVAARLHMAQQWRVFARLLLHSVLGISAFALLIGLIATL